jgi:hypothetical protein
MSKYIKLDDVVKLILEEGLFCDTQEDREYSADRVRELPAADVIPIGVELWSDRFEIKRRGWRSEDREHMAESFMIVRKEDNK